jgi:hypothetical protein
MRVKLMNPWLAPTEPFRHSDSRSFSGHYYPQGEHDMPSSYRDVLPSSAIILSDEKYHEVRVEMGDRIQDFDEARANADAEGEAFARVEAKLSNIEKARLARKESLANRKSAELKSHLAQ